MVDQALSMLDQYDLDVKSVRKGRGNWIVSCNNGEFVLKEYSGSKERVLLQDVLTKQICDKTGVHIQEIVRNKEGALLSEDGEEGIYVLQTYMEGRECNVRDSKECCLAVKTMAQMHQGMFLKGEVCKYAKPYSLKREFTKRNTELRRIRRYLKEKRQKNNFELFLYKHFNLFFEQALQVEEEWEQYERLCEQQEDGMWFCHGDYQHHNVWLNYQEVMILQFEKFTADFPCRDLYLFMRKLLEKNNWDNTIGRNALDIYENIRPLPALEKISMIYRFAYPEKFWKIANYYFNSKKSFMPDKNMEKLQRVLEQEKSREIFLNETMRKLV